jgi:hypothetical protein
MVFRSRKIPRTSAIVACALLLLLAGCQRKGIDELVASELFTITLGRMENQIDLFRFESTNPARKNAVYMRDGWFYVANGNAGKIMVFSSYGDLLFLLYNPQSNPVPTLLGPVDPNASEEVSTRGAVAYPFTDIGEIAVASDKTLYVEDAVAEAKQVKDPARGIVLARVVLRFDRKGKPLGYIGQEGVGGTPFPYVSALHVTSNDQLVVVCRLPDYSWEIFWYSREGTPLFQVQIDKTHLPVSPTKDATPVLIDVFPDQHGPLLYLIVDTYAASTDSSSASSNADTVVSRAYKLDMRSGKYSSTYVEFPQNPPRKEKAGLRTSTIPSPPADCLGVTANGNFSLLAYTDTNLYTLQVLDPTGKVKARRRMVIEDSELTFRDVHLSSTGIIYGLLADKTKAHISWWRADMLLKGE